MTDSILSPDVHEVIAAIKAIDPDYNLSEDLVGVSMRDAICSYSQSARNLTVGKSNDFCQGVILTLQLHKEGKL